MVAELAIDWMPSEWDCRGRVRPNIACERIIFGKQRWLHVRLIIVIMYYNSISPRAFHATIASQIRTIHRKRKTSNSEFLASCLLFRFMSIRFWWAFHFYYVDPDGAWVHLQTKTKLNYVYGWTVNSGARPNAKVRYRVSGRESFLLEKLLGANKHKNKST